MKKTLALGICLSLLACSGSSKTAETTAAQPALGDNANLASITLSTGQLTPAFTSDNLHYSVSLANEVAQVAVTATAADEDARVAIDGAAMPTGAAAAIGLAVGHRVVDIRVTSEDGHHVKAYQVELVRAAPAQPVTPTPPAPIPPAPPAAVAAPAFQPASGTTFTGVLTVSLSSTTAGAAIYYTTDGSLPDRNATLYAGAFRLTTSATVKAIAVKAGLTDSGIATASYVEQSVVPPPPPPPPPPAEQVASPTFSPAPGTTFFTSSLDVTLTSTTPGAEVHYTLDGTPPSAASTLYTGPITLHGSATIQAIATRAGATDSAPATASYAASTQVPPDVKLQGYTVSGTSVTFVFDEATYHLSSSPNEVSVRGSFNGWAKNSAWTLTRSSTMPGIWLLTKPAADVAVPANSGQPEFKFVDSSPADHWNEVPTALPAGHKFLGNDIVLFAQDGAARIAEIAANEVLANTVKQAGDYNLSDPAQAAVFANFRAVPGTSYLFRSYHPYKWSIDTGSTADTERARTDQVKALMQSHGILSIVTMSSQVAGQADAPTGSESIAPYQQSLINQGHDLFLSTDYNTVYFASDGAVFGGLVRSAVQFIVAPGTQVPVLVHCYLGTDRTGVMSAVLAGLSGASWSDLVADFQKSNLVGNKQFRDGRLLAYAFQRILKADPATVPNLKAALSTYFVGGGYLTQGEIDQLTTKLTHGN